MNIETISEQRCHGGVQGFYAHSSDETRTTMRFAVFQPEAARRRPVPVLYYLAGLTCAEDTATIKAGAQAHAARHGIMLVMPDTSPRGAGIGGEDDDWDFGTGAGFYVDATCEPWSNHYRMYSYVSAELPALVESTFNVLPDAAGIFGHSMGGHGALTIGLKNRQRYRSISAFAPICAPLHCPWGHKALTGYLGEDRAAWFDYDACELIRADPSHHVLLVDQGDADQFLTEQLRPELLERACQESGQTLNLRRHAGYDHSYYFITTFIADHLDHHARLLNAD